MSQVLKWEEFLDLLPDDLSGEEGVTLQAAYNALHDSHEALRAELAKVTKERDETRDAQKISFANGQLSGRVEGAAEERARIVTWVRKGACKSPCGCCNLERDVSAAIERGEHAKEPA